jgi:hypothetical protein
MNKELEKVKDMALKLYGLFGVLYPVLQFYLLGKGITLPPLNDWTTPIQITGALALAQAKPVVHK